MKAFVVLAVLGAAFGSPTENTEEVHLWKDAKAPVSLFLAGDNERKFRAIEDKHEDHMRSYYDVPHGPPALVAPAALVSAASAVGPAAIAPAGPALGVFPGAKVGGCAIPLLLSCAPNVHSGHLAQQSYAAPAYRSDADHKMRASELQWARSEASHMLSPDELQQQGFQNIDAQQRQWMETERAMETEMDPHHHHHHHLVALDIHPNNHQHQL